MERAYYSIIPATIMHDETLSANEKLLYAEITALANSKGYCFASNKALAEKLATSDRSIQRWLKKMVEKEYIVVKIIRDDDNKVIERRIYINDVPAKQEKEADTLTTELSPPHDTDDVTSRQNCRVSITEENITRKKEYTTYTPKKETKKRFVPPTVEEIRDYCKQRNNNVDAQRVYDFYNASEWKDSRGKPVLNWKQKIIGVWEKEIPESKEKSPNTKKVPDFTNPWNQEIEPHVKIKLEDLPF